MNAWVYIDGVAMPIPEECPITEYDLDSAATGRPESGMMFRERIRANLMSGDFTWKNLTVAEANKLRNALMPASFTCRMHFLGTTVEKIMYAGDRHWTPAYSGSGEERWNLSVQLSEY